MNVLYIVHVSGKGGACYALLSLIDNIKKNGVSPYVLIPRQGYICDELVKRNIPYDIIPFKSGVVGKQYQKSIFFGLKQIKHFYEQLSLAKTINKYVKKWDIDIIHSNSTYVMCGSLAGIMYNVPTVWHLREQIEEHFQSRFFQNKFIMRTLFKRTSRVVAVSQYIKESYQQYLTSASVDILYDGASVPKMKEKYELGKTINVLYMGGLSNKKGFGDIDLLYHAFLKNDFHNYKIYLNGINSDEFTNYVQENEWDENIIKYVEFTNGFSKDSLDDYRSDMDIFFMPSAKEAYGLVTIEAMMIGLPVIAIKSGGNVELIEDGITGYLYSPNSQDELSEKLNNLITDDERRISIINNARKWVSIYASADDAGKKIVQTYNEIIRK